MPAPAPVTTPIPASAPMPPSSPPSQAPNQPPQNLTKAVSLAPKPPVIQVIKQAAAPI